MYTNIEDYFNQKILKIIKKYSISSIILAISGGQDSICLINLIENLKKKINIIYIKIDIEYIYIDHQWQKNSHKQIKHLINYIKSLKANIAVYQIKNITLSEKNCREYRYHTIIQHAIKNNSQLIITAHTETDKVETFLQNIIRGTGLEGISSLNLERKLTQNLYILRPLINISREQIYSICKQYYLPIWSDVSNNHYNISRNRIRHELLPYLINYFNLEIQKNIKSLITYYYYENEYMKKHTIKTYLKCLNSRYIAINLKLIKKQNFILQTRIIQIFIFHNFCIYLNKKKLINIIKIINKSNKKIIFQLKWKFFYINLTNQWLYITMN
uniref:tRNA(Ile)-lysidine synthase, chloroplastic n=1 Tax=Sonderella linearis TaxID=110477 RepID=A0A1Z1MM98_9FLOR|nr:tRNA Ile-lysidine synthetase [Sonderella linearis]ARW66979.1 tRNA Ile-lysidine synthetase [Sonderella linearis]